MKVFSWNDIINPDEHVKAFFCDGTAITIGGFDGPHSGHDSLFEWVINQKKLKSNIKTGVVTFSRPPKLTDVVSFPTQSKQIGIIEEDAENTYYGEISTLKLKLDFIALKRFDFAIVIDFSDDFSKMKGKDFLSILKEVCSMQFLAAGSDFRCGFNLDTGVAELAVFTKQHGIVFSIIDDVLYKGKRISSSSIRQCVLSGDLCNAAGQLGHKYTVDCSNINWYASKTCSGTIEVARVAFVQIMPLKGVYKICVECGNTVLNTVLYADFDSLRLEVPPEYLSQSIKKIIFNS